LALAEGMTLGSYIRSRLLPRARTLSKGDVRVWMQAAIAKLYASLNRIGKQHQPALPMR